ncbi:MAG: hypothetical protein WKG07_02100 [Hymenobacter sp.]
MAEALRQLPPDQRDDSLQLNTGAVNDRLLDLGRGPVAPDGPDWARPDGRFPDDARHPTPTPRAGRGAGPAGQRPPGRRRACPPRPLLRLSLPYPCPTAAAAAQEPTRCVEELGFCGALACSRTGDKYMDHKDFRPVLAAAERLGVPLYLHLKSQPQAVRKVYYDGFDKELDMVFAIGGWGWHSGRGHRRAAPDSGRHLRPLSQAANHPGPLGRDGHFLPPAGRHYVELRQEPAKIRGGLLPAAFLPHRQRHLPHALPARSHSGHGRRPGYVLHRLPLSVPRRWHRPALSGRCPALGCRQSQNRPPQRRAPAQADLMLRQRTSATVVPARYL